MWTYSGDPLTSDLDAYRFEIGDTIKEEPLLQDEEIKYVLGKYTKKDMRLFVLFEKICLLFSRDIKKSLGPQSQDPESRQKFAKDNLELYRKKVIASGLSVPTYASKQIFSKGMHNNV